MLFTLSARATLRRRRTVKFWLHFIPCGIDTFCRGKRLAKRSFKMSQKRFCEQKFISRLFDLNLHRPSAGTIGAKKERENELMSRRQTARAINLSANSARTAEIDPTSAGRDLQGYFINTEIGRI